jgi:hypothetical protein
MHRLRIAVTAAFLSLPGLCAAQRTLQVGIGTEFDFLTLAGNLMNYLASTITIVSSVVFIIGAFMMVASRGKDDQVSTGKAMMTGSLIGMCVVLGSYGIYRTVLYFIQFQ